MKSPYSSELEVLPEVYASALNADLTQMVAAVAQLGSSPAVFAGSGGTMALATLAARLHEQCCRQPARACTSLELLDLPPVELRGAMLFTSTAKHPDARRVLQDFRKGKFSPATVVTHRRRDYISDLAGPEVNVVELPALVQSDGFLATGSILQIAVMLLRGFLEEPRLPRQISLPSREEVLREEVLVLTSPSLVSVATDIEVRLVESGLASVQVADFRNFAHGRHTGFDRRRDRTTVIVLSDPETKDLATATADLLPDDTDIRRWNHDGDWPAALVSLLVKSMSLVADVGSSQGTDPARPRVPSYGRRLYRLPLTGRVPTHLPTGVDRKLLALGAGDSPSLRKFYSSAGEQWIEELGDQRFRAAVLDYDGTICWTRKRRELPEQTVQVALLGLLEKGLVLGLASGRGKSLHRDLRKWIPEVYWHKVIVGLYNGAVHLGLEKPLPDLRPPTDWSSEVVSAISEMFLRERIEVEERGAQVTVSVRDGMFHDGRLADLLRARLSSTGVEAQVVSSGHSVDIVAATTCKTAITRMVTERIDGEDVISVGDRGQIGGNDHALLAFNRWSLTVDLGSADPTRCWFGGRGDKVGPDLLLQYLKRIKKHRGGFAMRGLSVQ